ncbi:MAG: flippase [Muribaculaceae bacterium]|nr:flippase [Muribaculaceae bacterium]
MSSVKKNIILNGINTVTSILFPIVTFPYAARILLPEGIGVINFQLSIINYIVLLTSLGIPLYAVKEVAKFQDEKYLRNKITIEIILLSFVLCLFGYIIVWILAEFIPQIHYQSSLFFILSLTIVFNSIGVNWFYQGIEDFQYITIRAIVVRTLSAVALFIFVKNPTDILAYGIVTVGSTVGNNFINFIHLRKHIDFRDIRVSNLEVFKHLKPALHVFILNLIISLYIQLNTIMLGFMQGDDAVGYFTAGTKISHIGLTLISSIGTVLLPRGTNLLQKQDLAGFSLIINKSARLTVALSLPVIVALMILATPVTMIFCGPEYIASIPVLYLNAPVILFIGLTGVMGIQILYPKNKLNIVICSVSGGAIVNIILNIILIPLYGATGAAISTLIAEFIVFTLQAILGRNYYPFTWNSIVLIRYVVATILMGAVLQIVHTFLSNDVLQILISVPLGIAVYTIGLYCLNDDLLKDTIDFILKRRR